MRCEKKQFPLIRCLCVLSAILMGSFAAQAQEDLLQYVDPFIGTDAQGGTFPGATRPFGMVQLSPDNAPTIADWSSGYHYSASKIIGFSHMHLSGSEQGDWLDVSVMPLTKPLEQGRTLEPVSFSHAKEHATPGFYAVELDNGIHVELTTTQRVGFHQYSFPAQSQPVLRFDMQFHQQDDVPVRTLIKKLNDSTVIGYRYSKGWAKFQRVYFAARTSEPFDAFYLNGEIQIEGGDMELGLSTEEAGEGAVGQLVFEPSENAHLIRLKVALSMTGIDQALNNLAEIPHWDFNQIKMEAAQEWQHELEKMHIQSADIHLKRRFYTALYHTALAPNVYSDPDGTYKNHQGDTLQMPAEHMRYTNFALADTYRNLNPLFTLTQHLRYGDMLQSIQTFYEKQGALPVRTIGTNELDSMGGGYAVAVLADAVLKDWPGIDGPKLLEMMKKQEYLSGGSTYQRLGYLLQNQTKASVSKTLENGFLDYSVAMTALALEDSLSYRMFIDRSTAYTHLFDKSSGFMRPYNGSGQFIAPFSPAQMPESAEQSGYFQGNAWQNTFDVPHDIRGLSQLFGGDSLDRKLDSLFQNKPLAAGTSGMIGLYDHRNAASQHIPYVYNYLGKAWKTQEKVRMIADSLYKDTPDGYIGREHLGQLSAWLVWSIAGMYPVNPVGGEYVIGSPMADVLIWQLEAGKQLRIESKNNGPDRPYIQSITFNGVPYNKTYFKHTDLLQGGTIVFTMGAKPNKEWGAHPDTWPSSVHPNPSEEGIPATRQIKILEKVKDFFNNL